MSAGTDRDLGAALLSAVLDALPVGVVIADASGHIIQGNAAHRELWGEPPQTVSWKEYGAWIGYWPESGERIQAWEWAMARALLNGDRVQGELVECERFGTGERRFFLNNAAPVRDADGNIVAGVVAELDVTEARRASRALRENEARLRDVVATLDVGALMTREMGGRIRFWSGGCGRLYGWTAEEAVDRVAPDLLRTEYPVAFAEIEAALVQTGEWTGDLIQTHRDGRRLTVSARKVLQPGAEGRPAMVLEALSDVTAQREAEWQLQQSAAKLEALRSELWHVARVSAAGAIAAALAHELNQPLTAIVASTRAAQRVVRRVDGPGPSLVPTMALEALDHAADQALRAGQIIRRLREFVTRGEVAMRVETPDRLITDAHALAGAWLHDVRTIVRVAPRLSPVLADRVQIQQVLLNLIRNGVEAMADADRRELTVAAVQAEDGEAVEFSVADTGCGMPPDLLANLFTPFTSTKRTGMGVGLSICQSIIEAHGGRFWAQSAPGSGTALRFTLSAAPADPAEEPKP